jgi:hypothetical protein
MKKNGVFHASNQVGNFDNENFRNEEVKDVF